MIVTIFRFVLIVIVAFSYIIFGLFLIPFGRAGKFYRDISGRFGRELLWLSGADPVYEGFENLESGKTYVFVGNHQSYVDIFLIQAALDKKGMRTLFMIKKELLKIPLFGPMGRQMGLVPVERGESREALKAMMASVKTLRDGYSLVVFPEGTRTTDGELSPFKRGAFMLAEHTGLDIVPFVLTGTQNIFPRTKFRIRSGPCKISFLQPIRPGDHHSKELMSIVEKEIAQVYNIQKAEMDALWSKKNA